MGLTDMDLSRSLSNRIDMDTIRREVVGLLNGYVQQVVYPRIAVLPYHVAALALILEKLGITPDEVDAKMKTMTEEAVRAVNAELNAKSNGKAVSQPAAESEEDERSSAERLKQLQELAN